MKEGWSRRWKALLIWASGYLSFIAYAVVGGYTIVKSDDEKLKKTAKQAFIVTLICTAISMFLSLYNNFGGMADNYYTSAGYQVYSILLQLTNIAKIVVYVVFGAIEFFGGKEKAVPHAEEKKEEENKEEGKI